MLAGMFPSIRAGQTGPSIVGLVWKALQTANPWPTLIEIGLSEPVDECTDMDPEPNAWWVDDWHEIRKDGYSLLAADFLASVEGVSGIGLSFNVFMKLMFFNSLLLRVDADCSRNGSPANRYPDRHWMCRHPPMMTTGRSARTHGRSC